MKIAILATAPQWQEAPLDDPNWEVWGISGNWEVGDKLDRMYEIHGSSVVLNDCVTRSGYKQLAERLGSKYVVKTKLTGLPQATVFDFEKYIKKHRPYFTSSISWMLAEAIDQEPDEIGLWGVNMAGDSEYVHQKPACTYLLGYAEAKGIKITIPESSELLSAPWLYAYEEKPQIFANLEYRLKMMQTEKQKHEAKALEADAFTNYYKGASDAYEFMAKNYYKGAT